MDDLGIQPRTIAPIRDVARLLADKPLGAAAQRVVTLYDLHGSHDDEASDALDALYQSMRALDTDHDGALSVSEVGSYADLVSEAYEAIATNDRLGDSPALPPPLPAQPVQSKPGTASIAVRPCLDLGRRAIVLTLWTGRGARYAYDRSRPLIDAIEPDALMLHTDPTALTSAGAKLNADIRRDYGTGMGLLWATQGDGYGPDPSRVWASCARAAERERVESLMSNCEVAFKSPKRGATVADRDALARRCLLAMRVAAPSLHLSFTTYDGLWNAPRPDGRGSWGGHSTFPRAGFLGDGTPLSAYADQVYTAASATATVPATYEHAVNRFGRADASLVVGRRQHQLSPVVESWIYLQGHHADAANICYLAEQRRISCAWAAPGRLDANGVIGLRAAAELARRNLTVSAFQRIAGLKDDGVCGPKTLAALGISAT